MNIPRSQGKLPVHPEYFCKLLHQRENVQMTQCHCSLQRNPQRLLFCWGKADSWGCKEGTNTWKEPYSLFFRATAQKCKAEVPNVGQRQDGWQVASKSAGMEKVCMVSSWDVFQNYNLQFALLSNRELALLFSLLYTNYGFLKTFLGACSCFSFTAIKMHALHRCMGNVNG